MAEAFSGTWPCEVLGLGASSRCKYVNATVVDSRASRHSSGMFIGDSKHEEWFSQLYVQLSYLRESFPAGQTSVSSPQPIL